MIDIAPLLATCPALADLPEHERQHLSARALALRVSAGTQLFDVGHACQALPLLLEGSIRVFRRADNGREISLYRVQPGELCIVTVSCLVGADTYPASGVAETDLSAIALPRPLFQHLTAHHPAFQQQVFHLFAERLTGLMQLVEEVAFRKLDQRLATMLATRSPTVLVSHQQLADELGSVREIVSRLLKQFEERGWIRLARERIDILQPEALRDLASAAR